MRIVRGLLWVFWAAFPGLLLATSAPVVVKSPVSSQTKVLKSLDFRLHARVADDLIGTVNPGPGAALPVGVVRLPQEAQDFAGIYQTDKRALRRFPSLESSLLIVYDGGSWVLFKGDDRILNELSTAGIPFRAISSRSLPLDQARHRPPEVDVIHPFVGVILDEVSQATYQGYIQTLQDFVTRNTYNSQCNSAAQWIQQTFQSFGLSVTVDTFQIGSYSRYNILAELTGAQYPSQIYYIIAHYDATAGLPLFPESSAPGADDDGSGAAMVLECARVMSQFGFQKTLRFAIFAGNEQGLVGSEAYVAGLPLPGETYLGVFDADMIGYSGTDPWPPDLVVYSNNNPASLTLANKVSEATSVFAPSFLQTIVLNDPTMVYSDHAPFWDLDIPAVLAMEDEALGEDLNPYYHSINDLLQYLDVPYAVHALKVLLAAAADLSSPSGSTTAYLTAGWPIIDDSQGNNNGQIEYGEFIYLTLPICNAGGTAAPSVNVTLSESDPYITFRDWQQYYGAIPALDTVEVANAFAADVSDTVPDEHIFDVTVTMTSGSSTWQSLVQMAAHAPDIAIAAVWVNDTLTGNGNGQLELGETADVKVTLQNCGSYQAPNLASAISTTSPYIAIQTWSNNYGTIAPGASAMRAYRISAFQVAPAFFQANFNLTYTATGGWTDSGQFSLNVGDITHMATGPDGYGYLAYDINDAPFAPTYNWIEINPGQGGPGTELDFTDDDQTLYVDLPFSFTYYGVAYDELSICSNGWMACGHSTSTAYLNLPIPYLAGPAAMIAPYWDDLSPQLSGSVSYYHDAANGMFIVEYYNVRHYTPSWAHETFEVILYDTTLHPTTTGDGKILMQYADLDVTNSCTVGIENQTQQIGIQYLYNAAYPPTATPLAAGMAILYTTGIAFPDVQVTLTPYGMPIQLPPGGGSFNFNIAVVNNEAAAQTFDVWCNVTLPNGNLYGPVLGPVAFTFNPGQSLNRDRTQAVPAGAPAGTYSYNAYVGDYPDVVWSSDAFDFSKLTLGPETPEITNWANWGEPMELDWRTVNAAPLPEEFWVGQNYPNPFNAETVIPLELPQRSQVKIELFNIRGQSLGVIYEGVQNAGWPRIRYRVPGQLASGMYFYRIEMEGLERGGRFADVRKMLLLK